MDVLENVQAFAEALELFRLRPKPRHASPVLLVRRSVGDDARSSCSSPSRVACSARSSILSGVRSVGKCRSASLGSAVRGCCAWSSCF